MNGIPRSRTRRRDVVKKARNKNVTRKRFFLASIAFAIVFLASSSTFITPASAIPVSETFAITEDTWVSEKKSDDELRVF